MAKTNITQYSSTPSSNTDINSINIDENCPASGLNNAIRELMAHLKNVDTGSQALTSPSFTAMSTDTISEKTSANGVAIDGVTLKDGGVGTTASPVALHATSLNGGQIGGRRNIAYNGAMICSQRGTSQTGVTSSQYANAPDRFKVEMSSAGTWTVSQSTTAPSGFSNSYKFDCTTADASLGAGDYLLLSHYLEGQDLQHLKKGTSDAEKVTLSFYVRSNKTGTYIVEFYDADNARSISKSYTISSANTFERKTITIDGDTTGAFGNDNGGSLGIFFYLGAGSNFTSGTLNTSWGSRTLANVAVGQVNLADSTDNEWYITGVQLEVGEQATPFEHRSFGEELALCQRYFQKTYTYTEYLGSNTDAGCVNYIGSNSSDEFNFNFIATMRAPPTMSLMRKNGGAANNAQRGNNSATYANIASTGVTEVGFEISNDATNSANYRFHYYADSEL